MEIVTEYLKIDDKVISQVTHIQLLILYSGLLTSTMESKRIMTALLVSHKSNDI